MLYRDRGLKEGAGTHGGVDPSIVYEVEARDNQISRILHGNWDGSLPSSQDALAARAVRREGENCQKDDSGEVAEAIPQTDG